MTIVISVHMAIVLKTANWHCCKFTCSIYDVRKMSDVSIFEVCYILFSFNNARVIKQANTEHKL